MQDIKSPSAAFSASNQPQTKLLPLCLVVPIATTIKEISLVHTLTVEMADAEACLQLSPELSCYLLQTLKLLCVIQKPLLFVLDITQDLQSFRFGILSLGSLNFIVNRPSTLFSGHLLSTAPQISKVCGPPLLEFTS